MFTNSFKKCMFIYSTHTCPYLGSTEREGLENVDTIVTTSLPIEQVQQYYSQVDSTGRGSPDVCCFLRKSEARETL